MPTSIVLAYSSNLKAGDRAPKLIICITISEDCVSALVSFLPSALVGGPAGFSSEFTGVEYIAVWEIRLSLPEGAQNFRQSVRFSRIMSNCTVNREKAYVS